jgi:hypothetical protein
MNVGYWKASNEKWFRNRRDKLLRGEEQPRTASEWRSTMRHHKANMNRVLTSPRELAASALLQIDLQPLYICTKIKSASMSI